MVVSPPPSYKSPPASMSRSRNSGVDIHSVAEAMLRASISGSGSPSASSTASKSPTIYTPESSSLGEHRSPSTASTLIRKPGSGSIIRSPGDATTGARSPLKPTSDTVMTSTSVTRERLRLAELKRDELKRKEEEQRDIISRLKREGSTPELTESEVKKRISSLKRDERKAGAESPRGKMTGLFRAVCSTDLLFLIDTTASMMGHINAAKEQVKSIVDDVKAAFFHDAEVQIAVVGYKDHNDSPNIQFLDFTSSVEQVHSFLGTLVASGGGDEPEDVLGGLRTALNASWSQQTRCIIHIADAPPHGNRLHDLSDDDYSFPGSEPHGLTHEPLLQQMIKLSINYALLRINNSTDKMAFVFFKEYAGASADCKLYSSNRYYSQALDISRNKRTSTSTWAASKSNAKAGPLFEETELGTTYSALRHLVVKSVTSSASRTAVRVSASLARAGRKGDKKIDKILTSIEEDEDGSTTEIRLETGAPKWDMPGWLDETLNVEGFSPDVIVHNASTLNDMMAHDDNIKMSITQLTVHKRSQPFAQGALRVAYYARTAASTNRFVVKSFKRNGKRLAHFAEDMRCQALCKAFALEFNTYAGNTHALDFIVTTCLKGRDGVSSGEECLSLEPHIAGTYIKYNNNCGWVNDELASNRWCQAAQAFSHFTFERSRGSLMVSDLQGVGNLLTDPAIHTRDPERFKLADANLGAEGFKFFFATHVCNSICRKLGLKSDSSMMMTGNFTFRESWPRMEDTVCCSNKLCGKIVRLASAKKSDAFAGYYWCDGCWPQLTSSASMVKWLCIADGPHHEFEASKFFYESQGRMTPRKCPAHREGDGSTITRAAVVGTGFWSKLKSATRKKSISGKTR